MRLRAGGHEHVREPSVKSDPEEAEKGEGSKEIGREQEQERNRQREAIDGKRSASGSSG